MKKLVAILITLPMLFSLAACKGEQKPPEQKPPAQRAAALLQEGALPANEEEFTSLRAELDIKLEETKEVAASLGLSENHYYLAVMKKLVPMRIEMMIDAKSIELPRRVQAALFQWSELEDFSLRMEGYTGILRALCEGNDMFDMQKDARDMHSEGEWPSGYFFDAFLTPLESVDSFFVCDEYLSGYGMQDAVLCSLGSDNISYDEAQGYIDAIKQRGLYTYSENRTKKQTAWYGCWVGDDGQNCFVYVEYSPTGKGSFISDLCDNRKLTVMTGNFDFMLCLEVAMLELF